MVRHGILKAFDSGTYIASVELDGSISNYIDVPTSRGIAAAQLIAGRRILVIYLDEGNPDDAVLVAVWA